MNKLAALSIFAIFVTWHNPVVAQSATIQAQINSACSTGGSINLPPIVTLTQTLNLRCPPGRIPVTLQGAPSQITCNTGATPCIIVGSTVDTGANNTINLAIKDVHLIGPGRTVTGSEGVKIVPTADFAVLTDVGIDFFDLGLHLIGDAPLLVSVTGTNIKVGLLGASVNTSIHLDGEVANAVFNNFVLSAQNRLILFDGPGGTGSNATFTNGVLNTTFTPGIASVYVGSSDGSVKGLQMGQISDWETACPYIQMGNSAAVWLNGISWNGDVQNSGSYPGIEMLPNTVSWLNIDNAGLSYCSGHGDIIKVESANSTIRVVNSSFYLGTVNFVGQSRGTFIGNDCTTTGATLIGDLTRVRASGNLGQCADR